jgi:hypothetical protein
VNGTAAATCGSLRQGWKGNPGGNQRNGSETLHEDILRLFPKCVLAEEARAD